MANHRFLTEYNCSFLAAFMYAHYTFFFHLLENSCGSGSKSSPLL